MVGRSTVQEQIRLLPDCFSLPEANKPACLSKDDAGTIDNTAEMLRALATTLEASTR